jgi:hypothetical protein
VQGVAGTATCAIRHTTSTYLTHRFQILGEPVLLHIVHLNYRSYVRFNTMAGARERPGLRPIAHLVHHLRLDLNPGRVQPNEYDWNVAVSILYFVPQLRSFEMFHRRTLPCHIRTLAQLSGQTLRSLNIIVEFDGSLTTFWTLHQFPYLTSLHITCRKTQAWDMREFKFALIALPELTEFSWTWHEACHDDRHVAWYLAQTTMAHGGSMMLSIPELSALTATALGPWIRAHQFEAVTMDLDEDALLALREPLCEVRALTLVHPPPIELFDGGRGPESLCIGVGLDPELVYEFLDCVLIATAGRHSDSPLPAFDCLRTLTIDTSHHDSGFNSGSELQKYMTDRLVHYACELDKQGVVLDRESAGVRSLIIPPTLVASSQERDWESSGTRHARLSRSNAQS